MHAQVFGSQGCVNRIAIESKALENNLLGDPSVRTVDVYVPAGHDGQGLPLLVDLVGFTSSGLSQTNWLGFRENLPERLDRLIGEHRMPPVVVAFPDCFTGSAATNFVAHGIIAIKLEPSPRLGGIPRRSNGDTVV